MKEKLCKESKCKLLGVNILVCPVCPRENMYFMAKKMVKNMCKDCIYKVKD